MQAVWPVLACREHPTRVSFDVTMSTASIVSLSGVGERVRRTAEGRNPHSTAALQLEWDAALPKDYQNVSVAPWRLHFMYQGHPSEELSKAFTSRNAKRYMSFLRACSWLLLLGNMLFVLYDVLKFEEDVMKTLIIIRYVFFCGWAGCPVCVATWQRTWCEA